MTLTRPMKWINSTHSDGRRALRICQMVEQNPKLAPWIFHPTKPELRADPDVLLTEGGLSSGERVLVRVALDLWSDAGATPLMDLARLDPDNLNRVFEALTSAWALDFRPSVRRWTKVLQNIHLKPENRSKGEPSG